MTGKLIFVSRCYIVRRELNFPPKISCREKINDWWNNRTNKWTRDWFCWEWLCRWKFFLSNSCTTTLTHTNTTLLYCILKGWVLISFEKRSLFITVSWCSRWAPTCKFKLNNYSSDFANNQYLPPARSAPA